MNGFLMMMTQNGKLLYISDNAAEYLGHSMVSYFLYFEERQISKLPWSICNPDRDCYSSPISRLLLVKCRNVGLVKNYFDRNEGEQ